MRIPNENGKRTQGWRTKKCAEYAEKRRAIIIKLMEEPDRIYHAATDKADLDCEIATTAAHEAYMVEFRKAEKIADEQMGKNERH